MTNKILNQFDFQGTFLIFEIEIEHNGGLRDVSVDYIHKSQDVSNRNLTKFQKHGGYCVRLMLYLIA